MKSMKTKLITYFCILIVLICGSFGFVAIRTTGNAVVEEVEKTLGLIIDEGAKLTESRISAEIQALELIAGRQDIEGMDWQEQQPVLARVLPRTDFLSLAVVYPDGTAYYSDGLTVKLGDRDYVKRAFDGKANVSDQITNQVTNTTGILYAVPIERDGRVVGVLIGRRNGDALTDITDDMGLGDQGYAYMINSSGTIIAHPDREMVMNQSNPIREAETNDRLKVLAQQFIKILEEKRGLSNYGSEGSNLYAAYAPIEGTDWVIVATANQEEVLRALPVLQRNILLNAIVILIIGIMAAYVIGNSLTKPIILAAKYAEKIADLDITEDIPKEFLAKKDEIGTLGEAFQKVTDNLRKFIKQVADISQQVASSSEELTAISQQSATAAEEVAKSANEQARDTEGGSFVKGFSMSLRDL